MAGKQVQRRRGSTAQHAVFTGAVGEVTVDTDKKVEVVHDGTTPGGFPQASARDIAATNANVTAAQNTANTAVANAAAAQTTANTGVANAAAAQAKADQAQTEVDALEIVVASDKATAVQKDADTGAARIPKGNNAQRPTAPVEGDFRYNSQLTRFEGYQNGQWAQVGGDSLPVFFTTWWPNRAAVPAGFVVADGQVLNRATYPDAAAGVAAGNVPVVTDANWLADPINRGSYTPGNGTTTFRVPDYNGKYAGSHGAVFQRGDGTRSAVTNGLIQLDALQNITGTVSAYMRAANAGATGALGATQYSATPPKAGVQGADAGDMATINFDASRMARTSTETRPLSVTGCWVVKLFGAVINPGAADAAQLASDFANLSSRTTTLENKPGIGWGQAWQEVTASRAVDTTYTNTSGKPIQLSVLFMSTSAANTTVGLFVNGVPLYGTHAAFAGNAVPCVPAIIPPGATYVLTVYGGTATLNRWSELR